MAKNKTNLEDGEARKLASNADRKKFMQQLKAIDEKMADLRADRKAIYDAADNNGLDKKGLKSAYRLWKDTPSEELKLEINRNLAACGNAPLFTFAEGEEEAA